MVFRIEVPYLGRGDGRIWSATNHSIHCIQEANVPGTESLQQVLPKLVFPTERHKILPSQKRLQKTCCKPVKGKDRLPTIIFQGQAGKNFGGVPQDYKSAFFFPKASRCDTSQITSLKWSETAPKRSKKSSLKIHYRKDEFLHKAAIFGFQPLDFGGCI